MTNNDAKIYDVRPPPPGRESIMVGDGRRLRVEHVGSIGMIFHGYTDEGHPLDDVSYRSRFQPCSYVHVTRLLARTMEGRPRENSMPENDLLRQLRYPVSPTPQVFVCRVFQVFPLSKVEVIGG